MILPPKKMADFKDTVKTTMQTNALFEHLTTFWFPIIINEYTAEFQSTKTSKDAKFKQCLYLKLPPPSCYEQNRCAECTLQHL